jgi:hypothetical protein
LGLRRSRWTGALNSQISTLSLKTPSPSIIREIFRLFVAVAVLIGRDIWHSATARDDGEEKESDGAVKLLMGSPPFSKGDVCVSRQRDSDGIAAKPRDRGSQLSLLNSIFENPSQSIIREIFRLFVAVAVLIGRDIWHSATARDDGEEKESNGAVKLLMGSPPFSKGDVCVSRQRDSDGIAAKPRDRGSQLSLLNSIFENPSQSIIREISRLFEAVAVLIGRDIWHAHTARDDGVWVLSIGLATKLRMSLISISISASISSAPPPSPQPPQPPQSLQPPQSPIALRLKALLEWL